MHTSWLAGTRSGSSCPAKRGLVKVACFHREVLLCVRFRESADGTGRLSAVEPPVKGTVNQKRDDPIVPSKIKPEGVKVLWLGQFKEVK